MITYEVQYHVFATTRTVFFFKKLVFILLLVHNV